MKRELVSDIDRLRLAIDNWGLALVNEMQLLREAIVAINIDRKTENSSEKPNNCEDEPQTDDLFTDKYGDVWEWRGDAWYCISGEDEPQTDCAWK